MLLYHPEDQKIINWLIQRKEEAGVIEKLTDKQVEDLKDCRFDEFRKVYPLVTPEHGSRTTTARKKTVSESRRPAAAGKQRTETRSRSARFWSSCWTWPSSWTGWTRSLLCGKSWTSGGR